MLTWFCAIAMSAPAAASSRNDVVPTPPPPDSAPASVSATPGNAKVKITWTPVAGADGYRIYRGVNGVWISTPVGRTVGTSHTSNGLANGTTYSFTVAAYTKGGNGPLSLAVSAMPMAPPQDVTAVAGNRRVTLHWTASAGATSYAIYRKAGDEPEFTELTTGVMVTSFVDPGLTNGIRHQYHVVAVTAASASDWSSKVSATPVPPPPSLAPVLSAAPGNGKITLVWTAVPDAPGYNIYRSTTGAFDGQPIGTTNETIFKNGGLANDTTYFYTVAAKNMGGEGPRAAAASAVPVAPPSAPQNVTAVPSDKRMTLTWSTSAGAASYNIYRGIMANQQSSVPIAVVAGALFVDTGVINGATYYYRITATNPGGESPRSIEVTAMPARPMTDDPLSSFDFCDAGSTVKATGRMQRLLKKVWRF